MEDIIANIKVYVKKFDTSIADDETLDDIIEEVVDRVLLYTNREQLIEKYEKDLLDSSVDEEDYVYPIPPRLEKPIARAIVRVYSDITEAYERKIKSIDDHGQSITFSDEAMAHVYSKEDSELLLTLTSSLNKFRIPTVVGNTE